MFYNNNRRNGSGGGGGVGGGGGSRDSTGDYCIELCVPIAPKYKTKKTVALCIMALVIYTFLVSVINISILSIGMRSHDHRTSSVLTTTTSPVVNNTQVSNPQLDQAKLTYIESLIDVCWVIIIASKSTSDSTFLEPCDSHSLCCSTTTMWVSNFFVSLLHLCLLSFCVKIGIKDQLANTNHQNAANVRKCIGIKTHRSSTAKSLFASLIQRSGSQISRADNLTIVGFGVTYLWRSSKSVERAGRYWVYRWWSTPNNNETIRSIQLFVNNTPDTPPEKYQFQGRGVITLAGNGDTYYRALTWVRLVKHFGCKLPIEVGIIVWKLSTVLYWSSDCSIPKVWYLEGELNETMIETVKSLGATPRCASEASLPAPVQKEYENDRNFQVRTSLTNSHISLLTSH